jgi:outer membrane protein TolC
LRNSIERKLVQAEYELLKMDDPIASQREQVNRLMARPIDAPVEIDASSIVDADALSLAEAYAEGLASQPEIRLARVQHRKAELEHRMAAAERSPDVSLSAFALRTVNYDARNWIPAGIPFTARCERNPR